MRHSRIDQIDPHMAALNEGVGQTQADDHGIIELQPFAPPAQVLDNPRHIWTESSTSPGLCGTPLLPSALYDENVLCG